MEVQKIWTPTEVWWDPEHSGGCWRAWGWPGNSVLSLTNGNIFCQCSQTNADTQPLFQSFMLEHVKLLRIPQSLEKIPIIYVTSNNRGLPSHFSLRTWSYQVGGWHQSSPCLDTFLQLQRGQADVHVMICSSQSTGIFSSPQSQSFHRWLWSKKQGFLAFPLI